MKILCNTTNYFCFLFIFTVTYTADKINGFNAVVEKAGVAHHAAPVAKVVAPVAHVAPYVHAPVVAAPAYHAVAAPAYHGYGYLH